MRGAAAKRTYRLRRGRARAPSARVAVLRSSCTAGRACDSAELTAPPACEAAARVPALLLRCLLNYAEAAARAALAELCVRLCWPSRLLNGPCGPRVHGRCAALFWRCVWRERQRSLRLADSCCVSADSSTGLAGRGSTGTAAALLHARAQPTGRGERTMRASPCPTGDSAPAPPCARSRDSRADGWRRGSHAAAQQRGPTSSMALEGMRKE